MIAYQIDLIAKVLAYFTNDISHDWIECQRMIKRVRQGATSVN